MPKTLLRSLQFHKVLKKKEPLATCVEAPSSKERMVVGKFANAGRECMCPALRSLILTHQLVPRQTLFLLRDHGLNYKTNEIVVSKLQV